MTQQGRILCLSVHFNSPNAQIKVSENLKNLAESEKSVKNEKIGKI